MDRALGETYSCNVEICRNKLENLISLPLFQFSFIPYLCQNCFVIIFYPYLLGKFQHIVAENVKLQEQVRKLDFFAFISIVFLFLFYVKTVFSIIFYPYLLLCKSP